MKKSIHHINKHRHEKKRILFITPELPYTGAPRSLLRMCKVARTLGYGVIVWSAEPGPFSKEYQKYGFKVSIVPVNKANTRATIDRIKKVDLAVCNTILTDEFARICCRYVPTIWYIREATNIPYFAQFSKTRLYTFQNSKDLYCVSDYAANAIKKYTKHKVQVINNCVEDESKNVIAHRVGSSAKVRFFHAGTIEYRKGCDVLLEAYESLPEEYRNRSELYYAGRLIEGEKQFGEDLLRKVENCPGAFYLGEVVDGSILQKMADMDVIIVASRDESCSLVALEGAMLSKPLIVTENVGAKYIVNEDNGVIVKADDAICLGYAMRRMIDNKDNLPYMGEKSRFYYEQFASMEVYTRSMEKLFNKSNEKGTLRCRLRCLRNYIFTSDKLMKLRTYLNTRYRSRYL